MKKVSKRVSQDQQAYSAHGMKAPRPGQEQMQDPGSSYELKPTKGQQPEQGSKSIEQASKETASMEVGRKLGMSGKGKDSRAASAESSSDLEVQGPNQGSDLKLQDFYKGKC